MKKIDKDFHVGHRERLRQKFTDGTLVDYELLELLLCYAIPRRDVRKLAHQLMAEYGGMYQILTAPIESLAAQPGMGHTSAVFIKAMHQAMIRGYKQHLDKKPIYYDDVGLANYCRLQLGGHSIEEFHVIYLDSKMCILVDDVHSRGTADQSAVYPREIVKRALSLNARSVVLMHNHPTPMTSFSEEDIKITQELASILEPIGVSLYDHYVVSGGIVYSARSLFLLQ